MTTIPRAASLALWLNAWLRGAASSDDVLTSVDPSLHHVFIRLDPERPLPLVEALGAIRLLNTPVALALTAPGDPAGLAGPPAFNAAAMDSGEALLFNGAGIGAIPIEVGGALEWRCQAAHASAPLDPRETRQGLRSTLREVTEELVHLQIAAWNTEIPDLLMNRSGPTHLPPGLSAQDRETLDSATLCLSIVGAAREIEPGAISAWERSRFDEAMRRLDSAARHALVALCGSSSDSLTSP
ncbi:MAG: hypothetical protein ACTHJM_14915 [Marmoricola sp.]